MTASKECSKLLAIYTAEDFGNMTNKIFRDKDNAEKLRLINRDVIKINELKKVGRLIKKSKGKDDVAVYYNDDNGQLLIIGIKNKLLYSIDI